MTTAAYCVVCVCVRVSELLRGRFILLPGRRLPCLRSSSMLGVDTDPVHLTERARAAQYVARQVRLHSRRRNHPQSLDPRALRFVANDVARQVRESCEWCSHAIMHTTPPYLGGVSVPRVSRDWGAPSSTRLVATKTIRYFLKLSSSGTF